MAPQGADLLALPGALEACELCPRRCGARRAAGERGACGADGSLRVGRAALHFWEEPPLSGERGSGAVFFAHCPLRCRFCQNADLSAGEAGVETTVEGLASAMLDLAAQGAHNVNLVTATHYAPQVRAAVALARARGLTVPVVYNTGGYERVEAVDALAGTVDVWLPDCKYADPDLAARLSGARDYPAVALAALGRMVGQVGRAGGRLVDGEGLMRRGVIVRHLVLPGHVDDSCAVLTALWDAFGNDVDVSVMSQYTPLGSGAWLERDPDLARPVTREEYEEVLDHADYLGFENLWWQEGGAVGESFIPAFDGTGVPRAGASA
jgi:putative pyruvate formate lyase activating enzyme